MWLRPLDFVFMHLLWGTIWYLISGECLVFILFMRYINIYWYKRNQKTKQQQLSLSSLKPSLQHSSRQVLRCCFMLANWWIKDSKSKFRYKNQIPKSLAVSFEFYFKVKKSKTYFISSLIDENLMFMTSLKVDY